MRKATFTFLTLFSSLFVQAQLQVEQLVNKTWKLQNISISDLNPNFNYLDNSEFEAVTLQFNVQDNVLNYSSTVCATKSGTVNDSNSGSEFNISFENGNINGQPCVNEETNQFEQLYFEHIFDEEYSFMLSQNNNGEDVLYIVSPNMCEATFTAQRLSTQEVSKSSISIFPNPVSDLLTIKIDHNKNIEVHITDVTGKAILKDKVSSSSKTINFSNNPSGVYYISILENNQIIETKKIIKK